MPSEFHGVRHSNLDRTLDARKALVSGHSLLTGMRESWRYSDEKLDHSGGTYANFPEEAPRLEITRTHGWLRKTESVPKSGKRGNDDSVYTDGSFRI